MSGEFAEASKFSRHAHPRQTRDGEGGSFIKESTMQLSRLTDFELLCRLIGRRAAHRRYRGSLRALLGESDLEQPGQATLAVAWELMQRVLAEALHSGPVLESPTIVRQYLELFYAGRGHESFTVLYLDTHHRLIVAEEIFRGTLSQTSVYPREVVKQSLQVNAAAVVFAHNHPSGLAEPSRADEYLTTTLKQALALVDVRVIDHMIVGSDRTTSLAERGLL